MFPRDFRLAAQRDFNYLFKNARVWRGPQFTVRAVRNTLGHPRAVVVVPLSVSKKAVTRNAIKRRLRELLRAEEARLAGFDLAVHVSANLLGVARSELSRTMDTALNKVLKS